MDKAKHRLLWKLKNVEAWLAQHVALPLTSATDARRRGRPSKATLLARQRGSKGVNHG